MPLQIVRNDITKMNTEAIVNTANTKPVAGNGCDMAVYRAAGCDELLAYRKEKIGIVPEGEVFITPGFQLKAHYIIHAVSPLYRGGSAEEEEKLRSCYRKSLALAEKYHIRSIAFPLISTGSFGYPREEGMRIAIDEINAYLMHGDMQIFLVVFDDRSAKLGSRIFGDLEEYIDRHYVEVKSQEEYEESLADYSGNGRLERDSRADDSGNKRVERDKRADYSGNERVGRDKRADYSGNGRLERDSRADDSGKGRYGKGSSSGARRKNESARDDAGDKKDGKGLIGQLKDLLAKNSVRPGMEKSAGTHMLGNVVKAPLSGGVLDAHFPKIPSAGYMPEDEGEEMECLPPSEDLSVGHMPEDEGEEMECLPPSEDLSVGHLSMPDDEHENESLSAGHMWSGNLYEAPELDFETEHESRLEERMSHVADTYSEYLLYLIREKHMANAEVYKRAIVDKKIFSKIKNNKYYHPQKITALCLCVGARLNLDETKDLLARAGYALSPCDKTDIIFSYFIENNIYDMIELDIQLESHGLPCVIE